jgi:hypothetical protein
MSDSILKLTDILLFITHISLISINIFGWIFKKTRKIQFVTILATGASWFIGGIWYGWGYCILTDWEWEIKRKLGEQGLPNSFIHYLSNNIFSLNISTEFLDQITVWTFVVAIILSIIFNLRDQMEKLKRT